MPPFAELAMMAGIYRRTSFLPLDAPLRDCDAQAMNAEILLFDGFDELDVFGPFEGLADEIDTALVTLEGERDVTSARGIVVRAGRRLGERPDIIVVPGGGWLDGAPQGARAEFERGDVPAAIAARHAAGTTVASVCTGALLLAAAGVLDGRRATTNPQALDDLRARGTIDVVEARVVDDGAVLTAGAPSCGLDLAIRLLERFGGPGSAEAAARELQLRDRPGLQPVGERA
jgi:transcriptional regulator GlxA family with amidase domain